MFEKFKKLYKNIITLNVTLDNYKEEAIVQSLPSVAELNRAKKLIEEGKFDNACDILNNLSKKDYLAYKYLGNIAEKKSNFVSAVGYYSECAKLNPNDKDVWLRLGMTQLYTNNFNSALLSFEQANKITPNNTDVYTGWGMTYMRMKKYALARDKFNTACQISKYNYTAILLSAVMEIRIGEYAIAEEKLRFLVKVAPNESSNYEYAHLKIIQEKYDEAEIFAKKALEFNSQMLPAYFILSEVYSISKNCEKTEEVFNKALEKGLDCAMLRFEWGKAYVRILEFEKAQEQFKTAIEKDEACTDAKIGLALINSYKDDFVLLDEIKEKHLNNVYIQEAIGIELFKSSNFQESVLMFKKALKTDKNQTYNYLNLAKCYEKLNDLTRTRENYEKFILENPKYLKGLIGYSKWLINISDFEEANRKLKKAIKLSIDNIELLNLLFFTEYTLVKKNVCEYNIKEAISVANKALNLGRFDYEPQKQELESILKDLGQN
ncbi:tetratricopeptide repeat protein [bacterium]|nr:tetratricopeptide repeat protein [bacterium]